MRLKISVLSSGDILVDGCPAGLEQVEAALEQVKTHQNPQVWYYRETAGAQPPPEAMAVVQCIVKHKLPISLSSKPDFSDWVDAKGISRPRSDPATAATPAAALRMPDVSSRSDIHEI